MRRPIPIADPADERIAAFRDIRERDLVGRQGRFVAEGKVVLRVLLSARRFEVEKILVLENRLAGLREIVEMAPPDVPLYVAPGPVMDAIAGFHLHRGILAIGRKAEHLPLAEALATLPPDALVVVMAGISNHDNAGAIFRNAAAFEADLVMLDDRCCDPLYRKAIRVSVGAALKVPFVRGGSARELAGLLGDAGFRCLALTPSGRTEIGEVEGGGRTALFLGSEGEGLSPEVMATMQTARIAMSADFDSLNVAAASAIALHRLWRGSAR